MTAKVLKTSYFNIHYEGNNVFYQLLEVILLITVLLAIFLKLLYQKLTTNPAFAVAFYRYLNYLDDNTWFNLNEHRYLTGPNLPVTKENFNLPLANVISGAIPSDLRGLFIRIGPNAIPEKISHRFHWFDGDGMIHAIRIPSIEGRSSDEAMAYYSNQYVETPNYLLSKKYHGMVNPQLGELYGILGLMKLFYSKLIFSKAFPQLTPLTNGVANTAINYYDNKIYLGYESNLPFEIRWRDCNYSINVFLSSTDCSLPPVESIGYESFDNALNYPFTAHPKKDPNSKETLYFNGYSVDGSVSPMKYGKIRNSVVLEYFEIPLSYTSFAHDMSITEKYVILYDNSIIFDKKGIFKGEFFTMKSNKPFRIGLLPKTASSAEEIMWFQLNSSYGIVHPLNAWDEPSTNEVVIVTPLSPTFNSFDPTKAKVTGNDYTMTQLRLNMISKEITVIPLEDKSSYSSSLPMLVEFSNIHPDFLGKKAAFGFSGEIHLTDRFFHKIVKFNLNQMKVDKKISLPTEDYICGEPVIVPRDIIKVGGMETFSRVDYSDYVYIAVFAMNKSTFESEWIVYDGFTMKQEPVVRISIPGKRVPLGFHGLWISEADLTKHMNLKW
jgi:carotenoid cleavage dioxygenase-like enzyme